MDFKKIKKKLSEDSFSPVPEKPSWSFFPSFSPQIGAKDKVICLFWDLKKASSFSSSEKEKIKPPKEG